MTTNTETVEYTLPSIDDEVVMIKRDETGKEYVWKSARGSATLSEQDKWSLNPEQAKKYPGLAEVATAIKRYLIDHPESTHLISYAKYDEFAKKNRKYQYDTISEALQYDNKAKTLYVLEYESVIKFYLTEDERQSDRDWGNLLLCSKSKDYIYRSSA